MNNILNNLLAEASAMNQQQNQYVPPTPVSLGQAKQAVVAETAAKKLAAMSPLVPTVDQQYQTLAASSGGVADNSAGQMMTDVRTLSPIGLSDKYGSSRASELLANFTQANSKLLNQQTTGRNWSQTAADTVSGVGLGAINSIGGIGAMGLGLVNADAGQAAAIKLEDFGNFVHSTQSPALQQRREILAATDQVSKANSDLIYQRDKAEGKGIVADLSRFGRGFMDGITNAMQDPTTLSDGIAEGAGSFLALAPISRAANAAKLLKAAAAKDAAIVAGKSTEEATAIAKGIMAKDGIAIPTAIGAMEAGGAYQGTVAEIANMTHEQLLAGSPDYAKMIADGVPEKDARASITNKAALTAAAITAPFAVAAGHLVKGFEGNPLKMGAGKVAAMNTGKETIEEGSQGITGAIAQNIGIQQFADSNKSLSENVGEQGGRGALYGFGSAGVMAAPSVLTGAAKSAAGSALDFVINRADKFLAKNEADSPASINRVVETVDALTQTAPEITAQVTKSLAPIAADTPEIASAKTTAINAFTSFTAAMNISDEERNSDVLNSVGSAIANSKTRPQAVLDIITDLKKTDPSKVTTPQTDVEKSAAFQTRFKKAIALQALLDSTMTATQILGPIDEEAFPDDIKKLWESVNNIQDAMLRSPEVMQHLENVNTALRSESAQTILSNPIQTPETAPIVVLAAQINPAVINPAVAGVVSKMAQDGSIHLTPTQIAALQTASDLVQASKEYNAELKARGNTTAKDVVTGQVTSDEDNKRNVLGSRSGLQHMNSVIDLVKKGDMKSAAVALQILGNFAESQANKVAAINDQYKEGSKASLRKINVLAPNGIDFVESKKVYGVTPDKVGSIRFAHRVTAEAGFLTKIYNSLAQTYPSLKGEVRPLPTLDAAFQGISAIVAQEFADGRRKYPDQESLSLAAITPVVTPPLAAAAAAVVKAKKERKPKVIKEPKPLKISKAVKASKTAKLQERLNTEKRPKILEQIKAELELRTNTLTSGTTNVTQTSETIKAKSNQEVQEGSTATVAEATPTRATGTTVKSVDNTGPLPWETDEEYAARVAAEKAGVPPTQIAAVIESIQAPVHDLKAETILLNTLGKIVGVYNVPLVKALTAIKDIGNIRGGVYLGSNSQIGIDDALTGEARLGVLFHEFGHHIVFSEVAKALSKTIAEVQQMSDTALLETFHSVVPEIAAEYESWLADRKDSQTIDSKGRVRVPLLKSSIARFVYIALTGQNTAITVSPNRVSTFSEWVADNVGKSLESNVRAQTIVQKFFKNIADAFNTLYKALSGDKSLEAFMPAKSVEAWVESLLSGTKAATPVTAAVIVPNAPSVMNQATAVTPPAVPKTGAEAYKKLLKQGETSFSEAFNLHKTPSRFFGSISPIETLVKALSSTRAMIDFVGSTTTKHALTPLAQTFYRETLPEIAGKLINTLNKRLSDSLTGTGDFAGKSPLGDLFTNPTMSKKGELNIPQDMVRGRVFNITEMNTNGKPVYNQELLESAVLGSLSWFITSGNDGPKYEASEVAAALGISTDDVNQALVDQFNSGSRLIKLDVIGRMAAYITDFWGVKPNNDFSQTATVGIPQAIATEILKAMEKEGLIIVSEIPRPNGGKGIETFTLNHDKLGKDYTSYPSFLGEMVNSEMQEAMYFGDDRPPVRTTQMGTSFIDLTEDQKQMVRNANDVVHQLNMPVVDMYKALGKDRMLDLFGVAYLDENSKNLYNAEHLESIEGKNLSIVGAYESLMGRVDAVTSAADTAGVAVGDLAIRMPYEVAKNGRLFMRGAYNEQASKVTRDAITPTRAVLDLSDETMLSNYMASLAQMLGVRVHELTREAAVDKATGIFNDALESAVKVMSEFLTTKEFTNKGVATIKEFLHGVGDTNMALHALLEYASYLEAKGIAGKSPLTKHVSNIYMEADGVGNGPTNAMLLFSTGKFTEANLINMAKSGMFFTPGMTMNTHRGDETNPNRDPVDLYQDGALNLTKEINSLKQVLAENSANAEPTEHIDSLLRLMQEFLGDISFAENGDLQIKRGTIKNPMMITIYGAGVNGIAGNILEELLQAIYVRMSEALQAQNASAADGVKLTIADAMFTGKESDILSREALYDRFVSDFGKLTKKKVVYNEKDKQYQAWNHKTDSGVYSKYVVLPEANSTNYSQALKSFKIRGAEWESMRENMAILFVEPMHNAINTSLGSDVLNSSKLIQTVTNVQSLAMQFAFKEAVTEAMAKSGRRSGMYISKNEQAAVMKELIKKFPMIANAGQQFLIAKSSQSTVSAAAFSAALTDDLRMMALVNAPVAAGVAGGPLMVIGYGDSLMMQIHSLMDGAIKNVLRIFDGMHMPVDKIMEGSRQINEAVHKTWQNNPLRDVATSFRKARAAIDSVVSPDFDKNTEMISPDDLALFEKALNIHPSSNITVNEALNAIQTELDNAADQHEARIVAMSKFAQSIDQMAAAGAPYQHAGKDISMLPPKDQAAILEEERKQVLVRIKARHKAQAANSDELKAEATGTKINGVLTEIAQTPLVTYTVEGLKYDLSAMLKSSGNTELIPGAMVALNSINMAGYTIKVMPVGSLGVDDSDNNINGRANPNIKLIEIASPEVEVWVHELVHAATYLKVAAVLNNQTDSVLDGRKESVEVIAAVLRLQELMKQFQEMGESTEWTSERNLAYRNAINSMNAALKTDGAAAQLNEFMAWATTNAQLIELGKTTTAVSSKWVVMAKKALILIRRIFLGSSNAALPTDFFNAVRFNTAIIALDKQPSPTEEMQNLILHHTSSYGNDARLNQLESTYVSLVAPLFEGVNNLWQKTDVNHYASKLVLAVETAFPMSYQEKSTFHTIVAALATEAKINPASIAKAQELYNHVTKQLEVEDFMSNPELQDPVDRYYAQEKYDVIMGKSMLVKDNLGRSSLMPVFLALASTNDAFRAILAKMDMPKGTKNIGTTLDVYVRNTGTHIMEMLSNQLSGVKPTDSVKQAIDGLQNNIRAIAVEKTSILDVLGNKYVNAVQSANAAVVNTLETVANKGIALGNKMKQSSNKYVSKSAGIVQVLSGSLTDKTSAHMAEGMLSAMNKQNGLQPLRDFANDLIGRVASNANIYDMIKQVRSTIASVRQEFRENVPKKLEKTFKTKLTNETWTELNRAMGKTDMAALDMPFAGIVELVRNKAQTAREIKTREDAIRAEAGNATVAAAYLIKSKQLANFMKTGVGGNNLYRNAHAIALKVGGVFAAPSPTMIKNIDELVSLYALRDMEQNERDAFNSLVQDEGLEFTFMYLKQQRADETEKALQHKGSALNHYKGYIPSIQSSGMSLIVADDTQDARLKAMSYVRVGDYNGAGAEGTLVKRGYYFNSAPTRGTFNQGIMQNVNITANGVSAAHGFTQGLTAGVITDPIYVAKLFKRINAGAEKGTNEHLMPIFDELGGVIAYERSVDPTQLVRLQSNDKLNQMLGVWRGRQIEEAMAHEINNKLVNNMMEMYEKDAKAGKSNEYVNIFNPKDKILADALKLMPADVHDYMKSATGNLDKFWVRRDMVFDAFGYRTASVGDAWTGNSRYSDKTLKMFQKVALGVMGNQAFSRLLTTEKFVQGFMSDARTTIVVKSVVVPALNLISNLGQLITRGVPALAIWRSAPIKTAEIESYIKNRIRQVDAEAELRAAKTNNEILKLEAEIKSLKDAQRRLTIWPLIEAGEFTAISDVGLTHDDIDLSQGRWHQYIEKQVDKLPEAVRNAGRYAYITKDTALFQGLQKAVQYGDFLAKAILYDDMVLRQKKTPAEALARITEEFVNYDRLPGRFRGYLEQMGMLWFYNFKLRSTKVAIGMLRNNPVHALIANLMPISDTFGPAGSPITDNFMTKAAENTLGWSIGPGMGVRAPTMNPWWQMVN